MEQGLWKPAAQATIPAGNRALSANIGKPRIGTAGWSIPVPHADRFPRLGSHLERYSQRFPAVEINSSFYRPHRPSTYERWAASVPPNFRFAVKVLKEITHTRRLAGADEPLARFLDETSGLGTKRGPLLVQLPPSLAFDQPVCTAFFHSLRARFDGLLACEPRHRTWFTDAVDRFLTDFDALFTRDKPVIFAFHGYPALIHRLIYNRTNHGSFHVHGFMEEGTTTTPFDMVVCNRLDRFHLMADVIDRVPRLGSSAVYAKQAIRDKLVEHQRYIVAHGIDMPEVRNWRWPNA